MKYVHIIISLIIFSNLSYSQNSDKKEFLYDQNWRLIERTEFKEKIKESKFTYKLVENDTALIGKILLREEVGKISMKERNSLIQYLESITNEKIDSFKNIVINYFFKPPVNPNGSCIDNYTSDKKYKRYFKKNNRDIQFFFTQKGYEYNKKYVFEEKDEFIRKLFFKYYFSCGNYVILRSNGVFLLRRGEYRQDEIKNKISAEW